MTDIIDTFGSVNAMYIGGWKCEREQKWTKNANPYLGLFNYVMGKEVVKEMFEIPNDSLNDSLNDSPMVSTGNDIVKRIRGLR